MRLLGHHIKFQCFLTFEVEFYVRKINLTQRAHVFEVRTALYCTPASRVAATTFLRSPRRRPAFCRTNSSFCLSWRTDRRRPATSATLLPKTKRNQVYYGCDRSTVLRRRRSVRLGHLARHRRSGDGFCCC